MPFPLCLQLLKEKITEAKRFLYRLGGPVEEKTMEDKFNRKMENDF